MSHNTTSIDVDLASKVQKLLLPKTPPDCNWCCIGVKNEMAQGVGGDYFDFIETPDRCQAIFIGDVTGHGLHASLVMSLLYGFIHHSSIRECTPQELASQVNDFLRSFATRSRLFDHFFSSSLFYSVIDPTSLQMHYINAGHVAPMVRRGNQVHYLLTTTHPLGFFDQPEMQMRTFDFVAGDRFLLYTDGISETFDARGEAFGRDRLEKMLLEHEGKGGDFLDAIFAELEGFREKAPLEDDCTAIVLDIGGT